MKQFKLTTLIFLFCSSFLHSQDIPLNLGDKREFITNLTSQITQSFLPYARLASSTIYLKTGEKEGYDVEVKFNEIRDNNLSLRGKIKGLEASNVFIDYDGTNVSGAIMVGKTTAYKYFSNVSGNVLLKEVDINEIICVENDNSNSALTELSVEEDLREEVAAAEPYKLQSHPGSAFVIFLDFDGFYLPAGSRWNSGDPIDADPSNFTEARIQETWELVAEDYRPFNVNVTTDSTIFKSAAAGKRIRAVITPTKTASPDAGGVAYIGSFTYRTREEPCWVFNLGGAKICGETISHEVGHALYLQHDGKDESTYYSGNGSWGPIMGSAYGTRVMGHFSKGEYTGADNTEDDLSVITTRSGFTYKADDHGNTSITGTAIKIASGGIVDAAVNFGLIEKSTDLDFFTFTTSGGAVTININPAVRHGNLDILAKLYSNNESLLQTANAAGLPASITMTLAAGTYTISIDGTGTGDPLTTGYSDYGSIGSYSISGSIPNTGITATEEGAEVTQMNCYPNPFTDKITIVSPGKFQYNIIGLDGTKVEEGEATNSADAGEGLLPGMYVVRIESQGNVKYMKVTRQ